MERLDHSLQIFCGLFRGCIIDMYSLRSNASEFPLLTLRSFGFLDGLCVWRGFFAGAIRGFMIRGNI